MVLRCGFESYPETQGQTFVCTVQGACCSMEEHPSYMRAVGSSTPPIPNARSGPNVGGLSAQNRFPETDCGFESLLFTSASSGGTGRRGWETITHWQHFARLQFNNSNYLIRDDRFGLSGPGVVGSIPATPISPHHPQQMSRACSSMGECLSVEQAVASSILAMPAAEDER